MIMRELILMIEETQKIEKGTEIIVAGDMNMQTDEKNKYNKWIMKMMKKNNLNQIDANEATCKRGQNRSLDHIFTTGKRTKEPVYIETGISDHKMVIAEIELDKQ